MSFTTITLTGSYAGSPGGYVVFQLTSALVQTSLPIVPRTPQLIELTAGSFSIDLTATNDPGTTPIDAAYQVTEIIDETPANIYYIWLPYDAMGGTIDITACPVVLPTPFPFPFFGGSMGGGAITLIESTDASITVTNGSGPIVDLTGAGGGGGGGVTSFNTRSGAVSLTAADLALAVGPSTAGKIMTSNGTTWISAALTAAQLTTAVARRGRERPHVGRKWRLDQRCRTSPFLQYAHGRRHLH